MKRLNAIVLGALMLAACTDLNVNPRADDDAAALDAPIDAPDAGGDTNPGAGGAGDAGSAGGGHAGASPSNEGGAGGATGLGGTSARGGAGGLPQSGGRGGAPGGGGGAAGRGGGGGGGGGRGGSATGGRGGSGAGGVAGRGGGGGGATAGHGGATANCPATTTTPCTPNMTETAEEACCSTGKRTRSRKCDPVTCQWGSYSDWSSCSVAAACTPGDKSACTNKDPCGNRVCSSACAWGECVPKSGNACICIHSGHTDCGSNYRCGTGSHAGQWQFCLSDSCQWSTDWADCSASNCEC